MFYQIERCENKSLNQQKPLKKSIFIMSQSIPEDSWFSKPIFEGKQLVNNNIKENRSQVHLTKNKMPLILGMRFLESKVLI
jgi:hypothetical protein